MPIDLFVGKSSVQTNVYVFRVGEAHQKDDVVKFIDFPTMVIHAAIVKKQAAIYLIQTTPRADIRKLLTLFDMENQSSIFSLKKNTTREQ